MVTNNGVAVLTDSERSPEFQIPRTMPSEDFIANGLVHLGPLLAGEEQTPEVEEPENEGRVEGGLKEETRKFLERFVEGNIDCLTVDDLGIITQTIIQANKTDSKYVGRPQHEDTDSIISSAVAGVGYIRLAELYDLTVTQVYQQLRRIAQRVIKNRGGKLTIDELIGPGRLSGSVEAAPDNTMSDDERARLQALAAAAAMRQDQLKSRPNFTPVRREPSRLTLPSDWFSNPAYDSESALRTREDLDESTPLKWQKDALCAQTDPEAFFPEKGGSTRDAKKICTSCKVKNQCLEYALVNDERYGIWGGLSERERRRLRKSRT